MQYFMAREQFRITDLIFSPMILMMVLPLLLLFVMPKLMAAQGPEAQKVLFFRYRIYRIY